MAFSFSGILSRLFGGAESPPPVVGNDRPPPAWSGAYTPSSTSLARDSIRGDAFAPPFRGPLELDNFGNETWEMRERYRELYRREPSIKSAIEGKVASIAALDIAVMPRRKNHPIDRQAADFVKWAVAQTDTGWDGLIRDIALPALLDGYSITEKTLEEIGDDPEWQGKWGLKHARSRDTRWLRLQMDPYRNVSGVVSVLRGLESFPIEKVIRFTNLELFSNPFGSSDLRAAYRAANLIQDAYQLWYVLLSNTQGPFLVGKYTNRANKAAFETALAEARANGWIAITKEDEVDLLNLASATNFAAFEQKVRICREEIYLAIRGAYLPFLEGSANSDKGNTSVHKVASDAMEYLLAASIGRTITKQLVPDLVRHNFTDVGMPTVILGGVNWGETKQVLEVIEGVGRAGLPVSKNWAYEALKIPPPDGDDDILTAPGQQPQPGPGGQPALPPGPNGQPDDNGLGDLPFSEHFDAGPPGPPPHEGLVWKPGTHRWINPHTGEEHPHEPKGTNGKPVTPKERSSSVAGRAVERLKAIGSTVLNTRVGRFVQAAEHRLSIVAHKTRAVATEAAKRRGLNESQTASLTKTLAIADFFGGYVTGGVAGATLGPLAGKAAMFLPSVSAMYVAYSTARNPAATWGAALKVARDTLHGTTDHAAFAAGLEPADLLAAMFAGVDPDTADWRQAVFFAALSQGADFATAVDVAADSYPMADLPEPTLADFGFEESRSERKEVGEQPATFRHRPE